MAYPRQPSATARKLLELEGHHGRINACVPILRNGHSPDFLTASNDGLLCQWSAAEVPALEESRRTREPRSATFTWQHPDASPVLNCTAGRFGEPIASIHEDNTIRIWRIGRDGGFVPQHLRTIRPDMSLVSLQADASACCFSPDRNSILIGFSDGFLIKHSVSTGACEAWITQHPSTVVACGYTCDGEKIISVSSDGTLIICSQRTNQVIHTSRHSDENPTLVSLSTNSNKVLIATRQGRLTICDLADAVVGTIVWDCALRDLTSCFLSYDGNEILLVDSTNTIHVLNILTREIQHLRGDGQVQISSCAFIQNHKIVLGYEDGTVKLRYRRPRVAIPNFPHRADELSERERIIAQTLGVAVGEIPPMGVIVDREIGRRVPIRHAQQAAVVPTSAPPSAFQAKEITPESECDICKDRYDTLAHIPITLSTCQHTFGNSCLQELRLQPPPIGTRCPICRTTLPAP